MDENFRYKTSNHSLHFVLRQIASGRMQVDPDFKEMKHWTIKEKSQFIESLMLGIPSQPIWCEESASGDYIVIEGSERLHALVQFVKGLFPLIGLKLRREYTGCHFDSLPYHEKLTIEDRYTFPFVVINYDTSPQLKCEFFRRLLHDTGNRNNQSARNFAWQQSFSLIQKLKRRSEDLVDFAPRDSRWRLQLSTNKGSTSVDEVFLNLMMIFTVFTHGMFEEAYLDSTVSIDDLLDWTMKHFDERGKDSDHDIDMIFMAISKIFDHFQHAPKVVLTNSFRVDYQGAATLALPEFYVYFIRAISGKLIKSVTWKEVKPQRFVSNSPAKNFISHIFHLKDD